MSGHGHGGCGCGNHRHGDEHEGEYIVLTDEQGESHTFQVLEVITVDNRDYAILAEPDDEEQAFVLRLETDKDGKEVLVDIEDSEEFERVARAWDELQDQEWEDEWDDDEDEEVDDEYDELEDEEDEEDDDDDDDDYRKR